MMLCVPWPTSSAYEQWTFFKLINSEKVAETSTVSLLLIFTCSFELAARYSQFANANLIFAKAKKNYFANGELTFYESVKRRDEKNR